MARTTITIDTDAKSGESSQWRGNTVAAQAHLVRAFANPDLTKIVVTRQQRGATTSRETHTRTPDGGWTRSHAEEI